MKPLPTLMRPLRSVDLETGEAGEALVERSDVAAVEALAVVAEAAVALELARAAREKFGGDAVEDFVGAWQRVPGAHSVAHALDRHVALIGFMGAGKSTLGSAVAERLGRRFVDLDRELEQSRGMRRSRSSSRPRARTGSARLEAELPIALAAERPPCGARARRRRRRDGRGQARPRRACVDGPARRRSRDGVGARAAGADRPLARDEERFRALHAAASAALP